MRKRVEKGGRSEVSSVSPQANSLIVFSILSMPISIFSMEVAKESLSNPSIPKAAPGTMATPAISEGTIYFRTRSHVVAVGSDEGN